MAADRSADDRQALSLAFMQAHPMRAARVLETLAAHDAAAVLARSPARVGAPVMAAMLPRQAADCLADMDDERALQQLSSLNTQAAVTLLRLVPEARRQRLVAGLPTAAGLASRLLLGHARDTVGAWADPEVLTLPAETTAATALQRLRQHGGEHATVLVTDLGRRLCGAVGLAALLRAPDDLTLAALMAPPNAVLAAHAPLSSALAHPGWQTASGLPVVDPAQGVVGWMAHDALLRALRALASAAEPPAVHGSGLSALAGRHLWQLFEGLTGAGLLVLPAVPAVWPEASQPAAPAGSGGHRASRPTADTDTEGDAHDR